MIWPIFWDLATEALAAGFLILALGNCRWGKIRPILSIFGFLIKNLKFWGNSGHFEVSQSSVALFVQKLQRYLCTTSGLLLAAAAQNVWCDRNDATHYRRQCAKYATTLRSQKGLKEHLGAKMLKIPYKVIILYFHTALVSLRSLAKFKSYS